jgi:hypothetical protein
MKVQTDMWRRFGPHAISIDLPMAGATRCSFHPIFTTACCINYPPSLPRLQLAVETPPIQ